MPIPQFQESKHLLSPMHNAVSDAEADSVIQPAIETASLLPFQPTFDSQKKIVTQSLKLLPVISSLLFIGVNIAPTFISCSLTWETDCLKLSFLRTSRNLQWAFMLGNLISTFLSIATVELLYSSMKKRYLVPEYIRSVVFLKINYMIGILSAISCFLYAILGLRLIQKIPAIDEHVFLQIQLMLIVSYNATNLYFLHKMTKRKHFANLLFECVLYRLKRKIFTFSSTIAAICVICGILLTVLELNSYNEKLKLIHVDITMAAILVNQAYFATYYVDLSLIEHDYQSSFDEEYYFQKKLLNCKNSDSTCNF